MGKVSAQIDGVSIAVKEGTSILEAARLAGLGEAIPALCYRHGSLPSGGCRLCQVTVSGSDQPVAACSTTLVNGMVIDTCSVAVEAMRREILGLMAQRFPGASNPAMGHGGRNSGQYHALLARYDAPQLAGHGEPQEGLQPPRPHPYLRFSPEACIVCRRCLQACEDLQGQFVFAVGNRGSSTRLLFGSDEQFSSSPCVSCGACVDECPTGALFDVDRTPGACQNNPASVRSVCGYCGVGCNVDVAIEGQRIARISGTQTSPVNRGHLCAKGRYAHGWARSPDRLTHPLLRQESGWQEVSWERAMAWVVERIRTIRDSHGADALGVLTSSRSTNEAAYLLQKIFRAVLGTNNVDCCARVCHSSTALALRLVTGTGAASASYEDIERAKTIVVAGANPTEAHPVIGARIKQAARRGARLIIIDPRDIELCRYAKLHLQIAPGANVALFNGIAKALIDLRLVDSAYVAARTEGYDGLREHVGRMSMAELASQSGLTPEAIREAARLIGDQGPALFISGLGLSELSQGTDAVLTLTNLALLTGSVGRPGAGLLPLRGQNNVQGNADMGSAPDYVTGYQSLSDPVVRQRLHDIWGAPPPVTPGLTIPDMLAAARDGRLKGMWIQGEDIVQSDPNEASVIEALESLDLLVVQELFMSETARFAHLVLPAAGVFEQDGTFTNAERRVQRVRAAVPPPGQARADWQVALDLGRALGADWAYTHPRQVMEEIARVAPDILGGVSYDRLDADGLQWPCPSAQHPGTATVHEAGFLRGRGKFSVVEFAPSPEQVSPAMPFVLITGRVLQHYNVGTMTRRTANMELVGRDSLSMNPLDAAAAGLANGDRVIVESNSGRIEVPVRIGAEMPPRTLFLSFHFPETHTNALTGSNRDPQSKCPEYKITAVSVTRIPGQ